MAFHPALRDVNREHVFYVHDGPQLRNLYELERELRKMNDSQFMHHVNDAKNDFYNWIFHAVKDEKLASELAQVRDRKAMAEVVERRITLLEKGETVEVPKVPTAAKVDAPKAIAKPAVKAVKKAVPKAVKKAAPKLSLPKTKPRLTMSFTHVEIPKVTLPKQVIQPIPDAPAVAPLPLSFEEVQARIRQKIGDDDDEEPEPFFPDPVDEPAPVPEFRLHHRIKHHVKTHAAKYAAGIIAGAIFGLMIAKYFT